MVAIYINVDVLQCKNVISKLQRRIDKEGHQIIPLLTELWKKIENSVVVSRPGDNVLDLRKIDVCIDKSQYSGVMELVSDVQLMLKLGMQHYAFSFEVWIFLYLKRKKKD